MPVAMTGDSADVEQLKRIEAEIVRAILPFRQTTEAAIVICALVRIARGMLNQYTGNMKLVLRDRTVDFLKERRLPADDPASKILLLH